MKVDRAWDTCLVGIHHLFPGPGTHTIPTPSFDGEGVLEPGIQKPPGLCLREPQITLDE